MHGKERIDVPRRVEPEDRLARTITVRLSLRDLARLETLTDRLPMPPMAVAREIIRLGLDRLEAEGPGFLLRPAKAPDKPRRLGKGRRDA